MTYATIPGECIDRVTSQNGDRVLFETLETPRPECNVTLKRNWQSQQEHSTSGTDVLSPWKQVTKREDQDGTQDVTDHSTEADPDVPRHSGASSSSEHTAAASGVPTVLGSPSNCLWKHLADYDSVDRRKSIMETCADLDRETVVSTLFRPESKSKRDRDQNVVQSLRD